MKNFIRFGFVLGSLFSVVAARSAIAAGDPTFLGALAYVEDKDVAPKLALSEEKLAQFKALIAAREAVALEIASMKDLAPADRDAKLAECRRESEKQAVALLDEVQRKTFEQVRLQKGGYESLLDPAIAESLKLEDKQKGDIAAVIADRNEKMSKADDKEAARIRQMTEGKLSAVLNKDQRETWKELTGAPSGPPAVGPPGFGGTGRPSTGGNTGRGGSRDSTPGGTPGSSGSKTVDNKTPAGKPDPNSIKIVDGLLHFNCRFQPWRESIEWFAHQADLSLYGEEFPQGTFNYTDSKGYTPAAALDELNGILLQKNFTLVRRDRMLIVVNLAEGIPPNTVPVLEPKDLDERGKFEIVSVLFKPEKLTPEEAAAEIRPLLGPQGTTVIMSRSNGLMVTETAEKLRTIRKVLQSEDNPRERLSTYDIKNGAPQEVLATMRQLLGITADKNVTADGSFRFVYDASWKKIYLSGKPEMLTKVEGILKTVDVASPNGEGEKPPQFEVYSVNSSDPDSVLDIMRTLLAGQPNVRLAKDPKTGALVALGPPSAHATIRGVLAQLKDTRQVEVFRLHVIDATLAVTAINKLFAGETESGTAPKIEAESNSRQILVRGTEGQIGQIRSLLEKMGEPVGQSIAGGADPVSKGNVRQYAVTSRAAKTALEQLELIWPAVRNNPIRVSFPSGALPTVRPNADVSPSSGAFGTRVTPSTDIFPPTTPKPAVPVPFKEAEKPLPKAPSEPIKFESNEVNKNAAADDRTAQATPNTSPAKVRFVFAKQTTDGKGASVKNDSVKADGVKDDGAKGDVTEPKVKSQPGAPIVVSLGASGLIVASQDLEALDEFEALLKTLTDRQFAGGHEYTVFYLKYARADIAAALLEAIFGGGGGASSSGGGGNLLGDLAGAAFGDVGGGLLGGLLGGGGGGSTGGGTTAKVSGGLEIIPDVRLNALIVQASPSNLDTIEELLKVIDQQSSPLDINVVGKARMIVIHNTNAESVASVVRQVYADKMAPNPNQQRQPTPDEFFAALRGGAGGGGRGGRGGGGQAAAGGRGGNQANNEQKVTIGVDTRSNSIVVSAPDGIYNDIEALVKQLDQVSTTGTQKIEIVKLVHANTATVQKAVAAMVGETVQTSRISLGGGTGQGQQQGGGGGGFGGGNQGGLGGGIFGGGNQGGFGGGNQGGFGGGNQGGFGGGNQGGFGGGNQGGFGGGNQGGGGFGGGNQGGGRGGRGGRGG